MWFRDSAKCEDYGYEWFADCAKEGSDAVCQHLHSTKVGDTPGTQKHQVMELTLHWVTQAAERGLGLAMFKLGRAYLKKLPSPLPYDAQAAADWFQKAIN